ncbi:hypothetical protein [Lacisediminihabitans sp.]|jgi:hypothetical protein|uniref:hypothetical protein n=1 Tax=Lacisediminihabitans sp. TaxID=2787631 RepID=UPI002F93B00D
MNRAEHLLIGFAGLLFAAVVAGAVYSSNGQGQTFTEGHIPPSIILGQLISQLVPPLTLVGLGILAGLMFARGLRWRPRVDAEDAVVDGDTDAGGRPE